MVICIAGEKVSAKQIVLLADGAYIVWHAIIVKVSEQSCQQKLGILKIDEIKQELTKCGNKIKSKGGNQLKSKMNTVSEASSQMLILQKMLFFSCSLKRVLLKCYCSLGNQMHYVVKYHIKNREGFSGKMWMQESNKF